MVAYTLCRVFFLIWNWHMYRPIPASEWSWAFLFGLRFDIAGILLMNSPLLLLWMLPWKIRSQSWFAKIDLGLFAVLNFIGLGFNFIDTEFVKFVGKRLSIELLHIGEDVERHSLSILWTYWYLLLALVLTVATLTWLASRTSDSDDRWPLWKEGLARFVFIGLVVTGVRGGYQFKPLHPMHAYYGTRQELGLLTLNSPFNFIKSRAISNVDTTRYFDRDSEAVDILRNMTGLSRPPLGIAKGWNVFVIIVESFASEYTGAANSYKGYTPFFDSLAKEAIYFKSSFANARRSIEGLPAVTCGLPAMMEEPIITSDFANDRFNCLPRVLTGAGYSTYFLHGAYNGSMHFDTFSHIAGFANFVGRNEYPKTNPEDLDPYWGVLDEPMLQYAAKMMDEAKKPTFFTIFTLSSHHPYFIPAKYKGKFPKGTLEIHESIGYADYALQRFFETAKTKDWFDHTIFVITADHTQISDHPEYAGILGPYRVPILFYVPGLKDKAPHPSKDRIVQQIDIMPSILDLLGVTVPNRLLVGQSVFDEKKPGHAFSTTSGTYWIADPKYVVNYWRGSDKWEVFTHENTWNLKPVADPHAGDDLVKKVKAVAHYVNQGLLMNSLYNWQAAK